MCLLLGILVFFFLIQFVSLRFSVVTPLSGFQGRRPTFMQSKLVISPLQCFIAAEQEIKGKMFSI